MATPTTSGTYDFQVIEVELIIREAFERIGILGEMVEAQKLDSARRSINFLLLEWMNKSVNLWTLETSFLHLNTNQGKYVLPNTVGDIIQANLRTSTRLLSGTAGSSQGIANNAFDGNFSTSCTQINANGNISYDYGVDTTQQVNFVGVRSNVTRDYTINIQSSVDNLNWELLQSIPKQTFKINETQWFDIQTPIQSRAYRIVETGGAILDIQELYFNNNITDMVISPVSRYDYLTFPNKNLQGRPSVYYFNSKINPIFNIWPVPSDEYSCIQYSYKKMMQDVGQYTNAIEIPQRFYQAMVWGLAYHLAVKFNPQVANQMRAEYSQTFLEATVEDAEETTLKIEIDYSNIGE
jgi:hypothetical protein